MTQKMNDIVERLMAYNPPDRTVDGQRRIAVDISDAANEFFLYSSSRSAFS